MDSGADARGQALVATMKPRPFDYARPDTIDEALTLLSEHGDEARVLAGGQSLMAMMNLRLADPAMLIDITRIPELAHIRDLGDKIEVGAAVTQNKLLVWPDLAKRLPLLAAALPHVERVSRGASPQPSSPLSASGRSRIAPVRPAWSKSSPMPASIVAWSSLTAVA